MRVKRFSQVESPEMIEFREKDFSELSKLTAALNKARKNLKQIKATGKGSVVSAQNVVNNLEEQLARLKSSKAIEAGKKKIAKEMEGYANRVEMGYNSSEAVKKLAEKREKELVDANSVQKVKEQIRSGKTEGGFVQQAKDLAAKVKENPKHAANKAVATLVHDPGTAVDGLMLAGGGRVIGTAAGSKIGAAVGGIVGGPAGAAAGATTGAVVSQFVPTSPPIILFRRKASNFINKFRKKTIEIVGKDGNVIKKSVPVDQYRRHQVARTTRQLDRDGIGKTILSKIPDIPTTAPQSILTRRPTVT